LSLYTIRFKKDNQVAYFKPTQGDPECHAVDWATLENAKTWKTEKGAQKYLENHLFDGGRAGERLRARWTDIEVVEITPQQQWHAKNSEIIRQSKAKYDSKRPVFSFRPKPEILEWLERERYDSDSESESESESDADLLNRKLGKLMKLEESGGDCGD
jgi:hypothetical protein